MREIKSVWDLETLAVMVRRASESLAEWQIVNEQTGDVLSIQPDAPSIGLVTLTLWQPE